MEDIKPNSNRYKESLQKEAVPIQKVKLQPVIEAGKASVKKKSAFNKLSGAMLSGDAQNVKSYIVTGVLLPTFKKAVSDIVTNGIDILLYGEAGHTKKSNAGRVSYRQYYDDPLDRTTGRARDVRDYAGARDYTDRRDERGQVSLFDNVKVDTRGEAEDILNRMSEYLENSGFPTISVADMYDLANISQFPHTYNNYGWRSVVAAKVKPLNGGGFVIEMPPVEPIK